ncbi:MAG TPA: SDR family oxidoreductase [Solirubrobacteraceae bacterium]|nr:SDR family oxidoreductase [Solirubrobacteraceae bacterium]
MLGAGLLSNRVVALTGAGQGLGRAFARAAASEGAAVVVNDIDGELAEAVVAEIAAAGGHAVASVESVASWTGAEALIHQCVSEFGAIDGLVNNAVAYTHFGPPWEESEVQIRREIEVAVHGTLFCGVHAMRHMRLRGSGSIINLTSRALMGALGKSTYVAAKGAIASVTYAWALELASSGVRVNALAPGAYTRGHRLAREAGTYRSTSQALAASPDVVAPAVVYLLSDLSSGLTGQVLTMLGGRLGLIRGPRLDDHAQARESWTATEISEVLDRVYGEHLQPVGFESHAYRRADGLPVHDRPPDGP